MPAVYYGDEEGMKGMRDPFCRAPYVQQEEDMREYYASLAALRRESAALSRGEAAFCAPDEDSLCILRTHGAETYLCWANRGQEKSLYLAPAMFRGLASAELEAAFEPLELKMGKCAAGIVRLG